MANVLERLVAKGRRVHHVKDQREVAFGLADLSTHEELHHRLVKKGGVKTLIHLLTTSRDVEAQRFSALAIANTSCAELYRVDIALQENSLMHLTEFIRNEEADLVGRQYCAMALGNLAADPENHSNIAMIGGIEALVILLKIGANKQDLESGRYAAFSLSNLASNSKYRKQIVDEGAIEPLILLACSDDVNVQKQALAALRGICISSEHRATAVEAGILDPLILMARSENVEILREVSAALNCLSSVSENKEEVSDRALSTIIVLLLKGDRIVERHACCTVANLAEIDENHSRLLDENGLPPLIAAFASEDLNCKGEAARAIANLSVNSDVHSHLLTDEILHVVVEALKDTEINCQRFAALCLANLATTVASQIKIVQEGAVYPLIQLVRSNDVQLEARRYSALALANLSATIANHEVMMEDKALEALFSLSNSPDVLSQYYVACTLANLGSNVHVHERIVQEGGIQPLVTLTYSKDPDVHLNACAALRGLSATGDIKMKIVQEGGLEPISRLLLSKDVMLLREATGCICNLSLGDENRIELTKAGIVTPLITLMQHEDMHIASYCCACLANIAEISYSQEVIVCEGAIKACIGVMRSRYLDVQREGGRLLANLCACDLKLASDKIVEYGGHHLLISFLLSRDTACQRVGAFGIGNLCTHERHRVTLKDSRVLEPLSTLVRSDDVNIEIQKFAMLAIVNLSHEIQNHATFVDDRILQAMISLSNSDNIDIRQYAALAVANVAKNMSLRSIVAEEGGLEPVLYLARVENSNIRREVLAALATLSFVDKNKEDICFHGGMTSIIQELEHPNEDLSLSRFAYCALANLSERIGNMNTVVAAGVIPLLVQTFSNESESSEVTSDALRTLGNLATNLDYGLMIMKHRSILMRLISTLLNGTSSCRRMSAMALSNIAANTAFHQAMINGNILDPLVDEFRISLDTKFDSDHETTRFCLLIIANLCIESNNHSLIIEMTLDSLVRFTKHRDIKCRQNAIIALGNLASQLKNVKKLKDIGVPAILVSFAFPPVETDTTNAQFQAIAGLRGLATNDDMRFELVKAGCCEPLILAAGDECVKTMDVEVRREATAAMFNLALSRDNSLMMAQSGIVSTLVSMMKIQDTVSQVYAIGTIANLAEKGDAVQSRLLQDGCLEPLVGIPASSSAATETKKEVSRCLALFANVLQSHQRLITCQHSVACIFTLLTDLDCVYCRRFASLAFANLTLSPDSHNYLVTKDVLKCFLTLLNMDDVETHQCVSFALHNICKNSDSHSCCEESNVANMLAQVLGLKDEFTKLHGCLALRYFSVSKIGAAQFIDCNGLPKLFNIALSSDLELQLEAAACLRNLSLPDKYKVRICREGIMVVLTELTRSQNDQLAHQACGVIANLAEKSEVQMEMIQDGVLHHIKFALRSRSPEVIREALRVLCNLSTDFSCIESIINAGILVPLIQALSSGELLCRRFASMTMSNLASNCNVQPRLVEEGAIEPLLFIVSQGELEDEKARQHAYITLTNLSASKGHHAVLLHCDIIRQSIIYLKHPDYTLVSSAALCLSNLASSVLTHKALQDADTLGKMETFLHHHDRIMRLRTLSFIRGFSASIISRSQLTHPKMIKMLLKFATDEDIEIQIEVLAALSNLSLSGNIGADPQLFLENIPINDLISFLCSADSVSRLFGALVIGNIASESGLQHTIIDSGAMSPLLSTINVVDSETRRCVAYTICNLCAMPSNRALITQEGGLLPIVKLGCSDDADDILAAMSTMRALSSCEEARKLLVVQNGVLDTLFMVCQTYGNHGEECVQEAVQALCWLSIHKENKSFIVKHAKFGVVYDLVKSLQNEYVSSIAIRCLSNCSEVELLHQEMSNKMDLAFIEGIATKNRTNTVVIQELSRFVSNLSSNHKNHQRLSEMGLTGILLQMEKHGDMIVANNAVLSLLNISANIESHLDLIKISEDLAEILFRLCKVQHGGVVTKKCIRMHSCAAIGCLLKTQHFYEAFLEYEIATLLHELLKEEDSEIAFVASFAIHQFVKKQEGVQEYHQGAHIEQELVTLIDNSKCSSIAINAVSSLRCLSNDKHIGQRIMSTNVLLALMAVSKNATIEMEREIAAVLCNLSLCQESKSVIAQTSLVLNCLLCLSQRTDSECSRFALGTLANCAENPDSHYYLLQKSDIVHVLIKTMRHKVLSLKRESSRAISNILSSEEAMAEFLNANGLMSINALLRCSDMDIQYSIALSLRKLASNVSNHKQIIFTESLRTIIYLCNLKNNTSAVLQSSTALRDLASNREMKVLITDAGGISTVLSILLSTDRRVRTVSAAVLHHLSISSLIKYPLYDNDILKPLCNQIIENLDHEDFLYHASSVMSNLAEHSKVKQFMWQNFLVTALIAMANTKFCIVHVQVARCICFISPVVDTCKDIIMANSVIETMIQLLSSADHQVIEYAITAIGNFAKDEGGQKKVGELGAFEPIANLINNFESSKGVSSNAHNTIQHPCWTLSRFIIPDQNKLFFNNNSDTIPSLIHICSSHIGREECIYLSMALCNISACKRTHSQVLSSGGISTILSMLLSTCNNTVASSIKALCNLSTSSAIRHQIVCENGVNILLNLVNSEHNGIECKELASMALCNLIVGREFSSLLAATNAIHTFSNILYTCKGRTLQETCASMLYNMSTDWACHNELLSVPVLKSIVELCNNLDTTCKRFAMMTLCNLGANDLNRNIITRNGALQASILMLKDECPQCRTYACLCLANIANDYKFQSQVVLHGGLSGLTILLSDRDIVVRRSAMLCLVNVAANQSNHNALLSHSTVKDVYKLWMNENDDSIVISASCTFVNLALSDHLIDILGAHGGSEILIKLAASSTNYHCQCAATSAIRRLTEVAGNRKRLISLKVLNVLNINGEIPEPDIQREVAECFRNLSRDPIHRLEVAETSICTLIHLLDCDDHKTLQSTVASLAYLAEDLVCRSMVINSEAISSLLSLLEHKSIMVYREVSRAMSNILSSCNTHDLIIERGLCSLLHICTEDDNECQYTSSLACRKIVINQKSHPLLMRNVSILMKLVTSKQNVDTKKHALVTLRDLSSNPLNIYTLVELDVFRELVPLLDNNDAFIQTIVASTLHHLTSDCNLLKHVTRLDDIIVRVASSILGASDNLLLQLAGVIANLSGEERNQAPMIKAGVIPALTVIARSNSCQILQNVSRALANLSSNCGKQFEIHQQGGMSCLMNLACKVKNQVCENYVAMAIQTLCACLEVRKAVVEEKGGISAFVSLSSHPSIQFKYCASVSICLLTSEESSRPYIVKEAISALLRLSTNASINIQRETISAMANLANSLDTHPLLLARGTVFKHLKEMMVTSVDFMVVRGITQFFASVSINDFAKEQMMDHSILSYLIKFSRRTDTSTQRYSSLAICNLSLHSKQKESVVLHDGLLKVLLFLSKCSDLDVERCTILTIAALALGTKVSCKETIVNGGAIQTIMKAMHYPDTLMKQCSSLALNSLLLSKTHSIKVKINGTEKDLLAILSLLDVPDDECVHNSVYALGSLIESPEIQKSFVSTKGYIKSIVKIYPSASIEIKRACGYFFSVLAECVGCHKALVESGGMESIVKLAGLVDLECQLYGAFSLAFLASNPDLQVPLVKLGAVQHLVSMMANESEPRHYAGLALLKLADNFENHIQIAEEGGIQALLKLGRSRAADNEVQYKASITVGNLASKAVANLPKLSRFGDSGIGTGASHFQKNSSRLPRKQQGRRKRGNKN